MKKIIITALISAFALSFCACEKQDTTETVNTDTTNSIVFDVDSSEEKIDSEKISDTENTASEIAVSSTAKDISSKETSSTQQTVSKSTVSKKNTSSSVSSANDTESEYDVVPVEIESEPTGYENQISGHWTARKISDENGNEVSGEELYGSSYREYGGAIEFYENGTFSLMMGVSSDDSSTGGTFTYEGGNEIKLHFYDDSTSDCNIENIDGADTITMTIDVFGDKFTVYFTM